MKKLGLWADAASMMHAVTAAYAPKEEPTIEELKSELAAAQASHQHANRALTNSAVALSDAMDHIVALQEEARKTKLEHQKTIAHLNAIGDTERRSLKTAEARVIELETRLKVAEVKLAKERVEGEPLKVVRIGEPTEWCVASRETDAGGSRDTFAFFHDEATARWFAERWRPEPKKEGP